jgi:hypothetical protein
MRPNFRPDLGASARTSSSFCEWFILIDRQAQGLDCQFPQSEFKTHDDVPVADAETGAITSLPGYGSDP